MFPSTPRYKFNTSESLHLAQSRNLRLGFTSSVALSYTITLEELCTCGSNGHLGCIGKRPQLGYILQCENRRPVDDLKYFHDVRLVWTPEIQGVTTLDSDCGELDNCFCRILFSGAGEPHWVISIFYRATEDDSGSHHASRFLAFFGDILARAVSMELLGSIRLHSGCRLLYVL